MKGGGGRGRDHDDMDDIPTRNILVGGERSGVREGRLGRHGGEEGISS